MAITQTLCQRANLDFIEEHPVSAVQLMLGQAVPRKSCASFAADLNPVILPELPKVRPLFRR